MDLYLVRHGRPLIDRSLPAHAWTLDPAGYDDVWALRDRLPARAAWYCSPEPKAIETAQLLTDARVGVVEGLREHLRETTDWHDRFADVVRAAFERPEESVHPGWEPLAACRDRVVGAVAPILSAHPDGDVVLVGHGTAWTVLAAALTGARPDLERWSRLAMPDLICVELP